MLRSVLQQQPFQQQPPEAQALLQACMKQLMRQASIWVLVPEVLDMFCRVPLLRAADYEHALQLARASGLQEAISTVWQAAVSAATEPALCSLPAFGGRRPDEPWLVQQLQQLMTAAAGTSILAQHWNILELILEPALQAAELRLQGSLDQALQQNMLQVQLQQ
uniref:Uncharacterized protein n=1 Tax=Tetradesmus obliquus TaxID=3088 RepID=A0A383WJV7_TETOB|eukprot:jgi/Sobl393_1/11504/SZX62046.1